MTMPRRGPEKVQLTAYVRRELKEALDARARRDGKPSRAVLEEVLETLDEDADPLSKQPAPKRP